MLKLWFAGNFIDSEPHKNAQLSNPVRNDKSSFTEIFEQLP